MKNNNIPEQLFYTEFTEPQMRELLRCFRDFNKDYESVSDEDDAAGLECSLERQIGRMQGREGEKRCPIEPLLYASHISNGIIKKSENVREVIRKIIASNNQLEHADMEHIIHHVSYWTWYPQQRMLIETIGKAKNDFLIEEVLSHYPVYIEAMNNDDAAQDVVYACVKMLIDSQNDDYLQKLAELVSNKSFVNNDILVKDFIGECNRKDGYLHNERIINELKQYVTATSIRSELNKIKFFSGSNTQPPQSGAKPYASSQSWRFGSNTQTSQSIAKTKELSKERIYSNYISDIENGNYQNDQDHANKYWSLGANGKKVSETEKTEIRLFLDCRLNKNKEFELPIRMALYELCEEDEDTLMECLFRQRMDVPRSKFIVYEFVKYLVAYKKESFQIRWIIDYAADKLGNNAPTINDIELLFQIFDQYVNFRRCELQVCDAEALFCVLQKIDLEQVRNENLYIKLIDLLGIRKIFDKVSENEISNYLIKLQSCADAKQYHRAYDKCTLIIGRIKASEPR